MNAQKFTEQGKKTPLAFRVRHPLPEKQTEDMPVQFLPDFGAIITNMEFCGAQEISQAIRTKPVEISGMTVNFLVEVWGLQHGKRKRLHETWYFSHRPSKSTPQEFINGILDLEQKTAQEQYKTRQAERPAAFYKTETDMFIDPWENARLATLTLLKREYPLLARTLDAKKSAPDTSKAFIADCVRLTGCIEANVNLNDPKFMAQLSEAWQAHDRRNVRKSKVDAVDWFLANPRNWSQLYTLPPEQIASRVKKATGVDLSSSAIEKRIERLILITPRKRGKPAKK